MAIGTDAFGRPSRRRHLRIAGGRLAVKNAPPPPTGRPWVAMHRLQCYSRRSRRVLRPAAVLQAKR